MDDHAHGRPLDRDGFTVDPVDIRADHVDVHRVHDDVGLREARRKFGGVDLPAALAGTLAALGFAVLLGAGLTAAGALRYGEGAVGDRTLRTGAVISGLLTAALAVAVGAWVAGRMARYDGGRNGLLSAFLFVLAIGGISAAGLGLGDAATDGDVGANLSDWWDADAFGPLGIAGAVGTILLLLLIGWLMGKLGSKYHQRADELIVKTREGGIARNLGVRAVTNPGSLSTANRDLERDLDDRAPGRNRLEKP